MLHKVYRLPSPQMPRVMKYGIRIMGNGITLIYKTNTDSRLRGNDNTSRFSFIVSKNVDKRATARNRVKRLLSESIRHVIGYMARPVDAVVIGGKELVGLEQMEVEQRIKKLVLGIKY